MKKKFNYTYLILFIIALIIPFIITGPNNLFGSKVDWINQHTVFPEYFRQIFYETGNLLPNFALNIGAGQNIFNFSYYGLLNPIVLISYLFPMIKMTTYITISNTLLFAATITLLYHFLSKHTKNNKSALLSTILIMLSSSLIFHFHRHFMFVSYMPFLILGLLGVDRYFKDKKQWLLIVSSFLMIMTSYFYSIIGIIILVIYGIYNYLKLNKTIKFKTFIIDGIKFLIPIFISILMSAIILLPTIYVILNGRGGSSESISLLSLLIPKLNIDAIVYDTYSLGLTAVSLIAFIHLFTKKEKENKFLAISLLIIFISPLIIYLLNGGLYVRNKVFITFLPIMGLVLTKFLDDLFRKKINLSFITITSFIIILLSLFYTYKISIYMFYIDILITIILLYYYMKSSRKLFLIIPVIVIALITFISGETLDTYVKKVFLNEAFNNKRETEIKDTLKKEKNLVRTSILDNSLYNVNHIVDKNHYTSSLYSSTYHKDYNTFFKNVFDNPLQNRNKLILSHSNNIMFHTLMGTKYNSFTKNPSIGYEKVPGTESLYQNNNVLPLGYSTSNLIDNNTFNKIGYPSTNEVLLNNIVTKNTRGSNNELKSNIKEEKFGYTLVDKNKNLTIKKDNNKYNINAKKDSKLSLKLNRSISKEVLFLTFKINNQTSCNLPTQAITINNTTNRISCKELEYQNNNYIFHYVLSENEDFDLLNIKFGKGTYIISDLKTYTLDYDDVIRRVNSVDKWNISMNQKTDHIKGDIIVTKDGYFATTIPYDRGFKVLLDNKEISYEKVNSAFLGFKITEGKHTIELIYKSPLLDIAKVISIIGFISFIIVIILDKKKTQE